MDEVYEILYGDCCGKCPSQVMNFFGEVCTERGPESTGQVLLECFNCHYDSLRSKECGGGSSSKKVVVGVAATGAVALVAVACVALAWKSGLLGSVPDLLGKALSSAAPASFPGFGKAISSVQVNSNTQYEPRTEVEVFGDESLEPMQPDGQEGAPGENASNGNETDFREVPNMPPEMSIHLSIAIDASRLGCSASHTEGDNRGHFAKVIEKIMAALAVPAQGKVHNSLVTFSGNTAESVRLSQNGEFVTNALTDTVSAVRALKAPAGADESRSTPTGTINAIEQCIGLIRDSKETAMRDFKGKAKWRRVLVFSGGGFSKSEFETEVGSHWKSGTVVIGAYLGDKVDKSASVLVSPVTVSCKSILDMGAAEIVELLCGIIFSSNPPNQVKSSHYDKYRASHESP